MTWEGHIRSGPQLGLSLSSLRQHLGPAENSREVLRGGTVVTLLILRAAHRRSLPLALEEPAAGDCSSWPWSSRERTGTLQAA